MTWQCARTCRVMGLSAGFLNGSYSSLYPPDAVSCPGTKVILLISDLADPVSLLCSDPKHPRLAGRVFVGGSIRKGGPVKVRAEVSAWVLIFILPGHCSFLAAHVDQLCCTPYRPAILLHSVLHVDLQHCSSCVYHCVPMKPSKRV